MDKAVDTMFTCMDNDLKNLVSNATCGPFVDPTKDPEEMVSELTHMCAHAETTKGKLEQLRRARDNLRGELLLPSTSEFS